MHCLSFCACVTPPAVLPPADGARAYTLLSGSLTSSLTSSCCDTIAYRTRHITINSFVIVLSCDYDNIVKADNSDCATSETVMQTAKKNNRRDSIPSSESSLNSNPLSTAFQRTKTNREEMMSMRHPPRPRTISSLIMENIMHSEKEMQLTLASSGAHSQKSGCE
jgi:hypothetical protein